MMQTKTQERSVAAAYMREHRAAWRSAGFSPVSSMAHEDDKAKLTAFADVTKFEKMLSLVNADDPDAIDLAATRNSPRLPTFDMVEDVKEKAEKLSMLKTSKGRANQAQSLLVAVRNYGTKHRDQLAVSRTDELDDKAKALSVIYANLATATYRLAEAMVKYSPDLGEVED